MYPYPPNLPTEEIAILIGYLRGSPPPIPAALHACWVVSGYALSQVLPDQPAVIVGATALSRDHVAGQLSLLIGTEPIASASVPWELILPVLADLLRELIGRRRKEPVHA